MLVPEDVLARRQIQRVLRKIARDGRRDRDNWVIPAKIIDELSALGNPKPIEGITAGDVRRLGER
jgi:hypothetical protein